jgi:DNA-binding MarR family transcriptional regulator
MTRNLEFCTQLARTYASMSRRLDIVLSSVHGISFSDYTILYHLQQAPEQKLRRIDLAERMGLTASGVTRTLLPMEKLGWVSRVPDARDARVAYAVLTAEGAVLLGNATLTASERSDALLGAAPDAQLQALQTLLARLAH